MPYVPANPNTIPISIPPRERTSSMDSEQLSVSSPSSVPNEPRARKFSITEMLGRRTSIGEAFDRYSKFTVNGDGFHHEQYKKDADVKKRFGIDEQGNTVEKHNQGYFLP